MSKPVTQVELELESDSLDATVSSRRLVCWVDRNVKKGEVVSLRDSANSRWKVIEVYGTEQVHRINRGWATPE